MDSFGHNITFAHLECMKTLANRDRKWNYFMLLEVGLRTT
jgi:hypothetical protein